MDGQTDRQTNRQWHSKKGGKFKPGGNLNKNMWARYKKIQFKKEGKNKKNLSLYSETLNNEYIGRIHQMSYSSLSDNGMLQIFSFLIKWLHGTL